MNLVDVTIFHTYVHIYTICIHHSVINQHYSFTTVPRIEVFSSLAPECVILVSSVSSISKANRVSSASEITFYSHNRHLFYSHLHRLLRISLSLCHFVTLTPEKRSIRINNIAITGISYFKFNDERKIPLIKFFDQSNN